MMNERIREVKIDEVTILQDIAKERFIIHLNHPIVTKTLINF